MGVIKHLDAYPQEGMSQALDNVLSWDGIGSGKRESRLSIGTDNATELISSILARHGVSEYQKQSDGLVQHLSKSGKVKLSNTFTNKQPISAELQSAVPCSVQYSEQHTRNSSYLFGRRKDISARDVVATRAVVFSEEVQRWKLGVHEEGDNVAVPTPQSITVTPDKVVISTRDPSTLQSYDIADLSHGTVVDTSNMLGSIATETDAIPSFENFTNSVLVHSFNGGFAHILHNDFENATKLELPESFYGGRSSQTAAWLVASRMKQQGRVVSSGQMASLDGTTVACSQQSIMLLQPSQCKSALVRHITLPSTLKNPNILKSWALSKNDVLLLVSEEGRDIGTYMKLHSDDLSLTDLPDSAAMTNTAHLTPLRLSHRDDDVVVAGAHVLSNHPMAIGEQMLSPGSVLLQTNHGAMVLDGLCDASTPSSLDHEPRKLNTYTFDVGSHVENKVLKTKYSIDSTGVNPLLVTLYDSPPKVDTLDISNMTYHSLDLTADWLGRHKLGLAPAANAENTIDHVVDIAIKRGSSISSNDSTEESVELLALHASGLVRTFQINDLHGLSSSTAAEEFSEMVGADITDPSVDFSLDIQNSIEIINDGNPEEVISLFGDSASGEHDPDGATGDEFSTPGESSAGGSGEGGGGGGHELLADANGAGEEDLVDTIGEHGLADLGAGDDDVGEQALGEIASLDAVFDEVAHQRRGRGDLEDDGVAGHEPHDDLAKGNGEGVVPRGDDADDAEGGVLQAVGLVGEEDVAAGKALLLEHLASVRGVPVAGHDARDDLRGEGVLARLAVALGDDIGAAVALLDEEGLDLGDVLGALLEGLGGPDGLGGAGLGDDLGHVGHGGVVDAGQGLAGRRVGLLGDA